MNTSRPVATWSLFAAALALVIAAMAWLSVRALRYERAEAEAEARAGLEETVRLALWRIDSAMAVILAQPSTAPAPPVAQQIIAGNTFNNTVGKSDDAAAFKLKLNNRNDAQYQQALSQADLAQRSSLNSLGNNAPIAQQPQSQPQLNNGLTFTRNNDALLFNRVEDGRPVGLPVSVDWPSTRAALLQRIADVLPEADIVPLSAAAPVDGRRLATIPARLVVPAAEFPGLPWSTPLRLSLLFAWACTLLAAAAVFMLLRGAISLSERRGAFVSAVTHELRTPLTTFRMYADMLAQDMIPEPADRKQYLQTLVTESDRLGHLIENVLSYARLERRITGRHAETLSVADLLGRATPALTRRADQAGFALDVAVAPGAADRAIRVDPVAFGQIALNLVDNACKYGKPPVELTVAAADGRLQVIVRDRGPGVRADQHDRLFSAFNKSPRATAPGIGLGLHLSRRVARDLGGDLTLSDETPGATFILTLPLSA